MNHQIAWAYPTAPNTATSSGTVQCNGIYNIAVVILLQPWTNGNDQGQLTGTPTENQRLCTSSSSCDVWTAGFATSSSLNHCWHSKISASSGGGTANDDQYACFAVPQGLPSGGSSSDPPYGNFFEVSMLNAPNYDGRYRGGRAQWPSNDLRLVHYDGKNLILNAIWMITSDPSQWWSMGLINFSGSGPGYYWVDSYGAGQTYYHPISDANLNGASHSYQGVPSASSGPPWWDMLWQYNYQGSSSTNPWGQHMQAGGSIYDRGLGPNQFADNQYISNLQVAADGYWLAWGAADQYATVECVSSGGVGYQYSYPPNCTSGWRGGNPLGSDPSQWIWQKAASG